MEEFQDRLAIYQKALYLDMEGEWEKAHELVQDLETREAAWIHAYLHRKEGDEFNAGYWYRKADKKPFAGSLEKEWKSLRDFFDQEQGK